VTSTDVAAQGAQGQEPELRRTIDNHHIVIFFEVTFARVGSCQLFIDHPSRTHDAAFFTSIGGSEFNNRVFRNRMRELRNLEAKKLQCCDYECVRAVVDKLITKCCVDDI